MPKKKIESAPVVSSAVSTDAVVPLKNAPLKKAPAKPRAKKAPATAEPKKSKAVTHRHKKLETATDTAVVVSAVSTLTPEQIRNEIAALAYSYYEARGYQPGSPDQDWVRAEQEFWARFSK